MSYVKIKPYKANMQLITTPNMKNVNKSQQTKMRKTIVFTHYGKEKLENKRIGNKDLHISRPSWRSSEEGAEGAPGQIHCTALQQWEAACNRK